MKIEHKIFLLSIITGIFVWIIDAILDYLFFYTGTFWGLLITDVPVHEIYIRMVILSCFVAFGIIVAAAVARRRRAEEKLHENQKWLSTTLSSIGDAVIATDIDGKITFMNPVAQKLTGWEGDDAHGKPLEQVFNIINEETRDKVEGPVSRVLREGVIIGLANHTLLITKDGNEIPIDDSGAPIRNEKDDIIGVVLVFHDITERKRAEEALAAEKERLSVTLGSIGDGVIATDRDGRILIFNKIAESLTGWTEEEAFSKPLSEVFHIKNELTQKLCENPVELVLKSGKVVGLANNTVLVSRDGTERIIADSGAPIRNEKGKVLGVVLVFRDITETRHLQELATRAQRLETAGRIAGQVAHDFNNLLGPLVAFLELAREELPSDHPVIKYIDAMEKSAKKMADINQQLLTLGRRGHYGQVPLNPNDIIMDIIGQISHPPEIRITKKLCRNLMNINGGPAQIHRIIANLVNNALDAMPDGGELTVRTENFYVEKLLGEYGRIPKGEYAKITISDTGCGIPDKVIGKIFDPFFTTKSTDRRRGSGLGLSVVHAVIEDHNGFVDYDSQVSKGSSFYIYFPITREEIEITEDNQLSGGRESLLIIDDDPIQRDVSIKLLGKLGYKVHTVESGERAIEAIKEKVYDLLILDMIMPDGIDGAETYKRILEIKSNQKAVIVSGYAQTDRVNMALELGASEYILKPLTTKSISRAIRKALDEKKESPA